MQSLTKKNTIVLSVISYSLIFILLLASYTTSAYPQGDDAQHLFGYSNNVLPQRGGWIANRVVDAFFNRFLFLLFQPVDRFLGGHAFFESFSRYSGLLNAINACLLIAITHYLSQSGLKNTFGSYFAALACSFSLTLSVIFGDTTHTVAYNLTLIICLLFITTIKPLEDMFVQGNKRESHDNNLSSHYALLITGYFTAFGNELFALFSWIYLAAAFWVSSLPILFERKMNINAPKNLFIEIGFTRYRFVLCFNAALTLVSLWFLANSGRYRMSLSTNSYRDLSQLKRYLTDFIGGFIHNPLSRSWALSTFIITAFCLVRFLYCMRARIRLSAKSSFHLLLLSISPLLFFLIINIGYFTVLFIAGYRDSRFFVASPEMPSFYADRSSLFLSPLLVVNLALALRCLTMASAKSRLVGSLFVLASMFILFSKSYTFFSVIRDRVTMSDQVGRAFEDAAKSNSETIFVTFCLPASVETNEGYPILPSVNAAEWYRNSYRDIFRVYYSKDFGNQGPIFMATEKAAAVCKELRGAQH